MSGERDLRVLLAGLAPERRHGNVVVPADQADAVMATLRALGK